MKKFIILFLFLFLNLFSYEIKNELFLPTRYYIGDEVELKLNILFEKDEIFTPVEFKSIRQDSVEVRSAVFDSENNEIIIHFTSFYIGSNTLPSIYVGDIVKNNSKSKLILKEIKINTDKIIASNDYLKPQEIEGILFLPNTSTYFFVIILSFLLIPYSIIKLLKTTNKLIIYFIIKHRLKKPYKKLQKQFNILAKYIEEDKDESIVYNLINSSLRVYLSKKTNLDFNAVTTSEISVILQDLNIPYEIRLAFINTLKFSDFSKFGGVILSKDSLSHILNDFKRAALSFEELSRGNHDNF